MQSHYTATIVNQIIEDRVAGAARARRTAGRRGRRFGRGDRRAAPLSAFAGPPRIAGGGR